MGFTPSERLWLTTKGGDLYYTDLDTQSKFEQAKLGSRGFGILDVNFANQKVGFACGGSGSLFKTGVASGVDCFMSVGGETLTPLCAGVKADGRSIIIFTCCHPLHRHRGWWRFLEAREVHRRRGG